LAVEVRLSIIDGAGREDLGITKLHLVDDHSRCDGGLRIDSWKKLVAV
jgi:hypothetical protein